MHDVQPAPAARADETGAAAAVLHCARLAQAAAPALAAASEQAIDEALAAMARHLLAAAPDVLAANAEDLRQADEHGLTQALIDRLRLDPARLQAIAGQLRQLAAAPFPDRDRMLRELDGDLVLVERRRPVGVIGINFEARPNVTIDVASQMVKSRNAAVLRTGSAALRSALALTSSVIEPALAEAGLDPAAIQLIPSPSRHAAVALVQLPAQIPLVILRGSGDSTRSLAAEAARHGVRTLAHADGGGVLYVDRAADLDLAAELIAASLDRLGVCNRLNLLLLDDASYDRALPVALSTLEKLNVTPSLPPHDHALGYEWSLDAGREATVTVARAAGAADAAQIANSQTSGLAAGIVTEDQAAAATFIDTYAGTGAFWNATTRLLDGFKLLALPETGINIDKIPGPRGPVTFQDLYLRQYLVVPKP